MNRISLTVFVLLLSPTALFGLQILKPVFADTIDVFPGESIQEAINSAFPGDTVFVHVGIYKENLIIGKSLTLIGESKENTIVDGGGKEQSVIEVTASQVVITGFTVQNTSREAGTSFAGIKISGAECNVTGNHVRKTKIGISVTSHESIISKNVATDNGHGIALYSSSGAVVESNNVSRNTVGISLAFSSNNTILGNRAVNSSTGGHGIYISSNSFNNTVLMNELRFNYHGMWLSASYDNWIGQNLVANNELLGIELANSPQNMFYHNSFANNGGKSMRHIKIDDKSNSIWNDDYPSGGNFWHGFFDIDEKSGAYQDQPGSDGILDNPYIIDTSNRDNYPLVGPLAWENEMPPIITVFSPKDQTYPTTSIPLNYSMNKPTVWIGYSLDDGANVTITGHVNLTLPEGSHNILLYANDTTGNMGWSRKVNFTIDTTPPQIIDVSQQPESDVQPEDEVTVYATAVDELCGIRQMTLNYTTSNGTWSVVNLTYLDGDVWFGVIPAFPYGTNVTYVIMVEDNVGNLVTTEDLGYQLHYPVVPEFPSPMILPLLTAATLLAAIVRMSRRFA